MLFNALYALLTNDDTVASLLGKPDGVYANLIPRGGTQDCVVVHEIIGTDLVTLDSTLDLQEKRVQFDCYSGDYIKSKTLAKAVKDLLKDYSGSPESPDCCEDSRLCHERRLRRAVRDRR